MLAAGIRFRVAHHYFAMFDQSKVVYLSGTGKELEFVNPHAWSSYP
jgi:hypothetical protein